MFADKFEQCTACKKLVPSSEAVFDVSNKDENPKAYHLECMSCTSGSCDLEHPNQEVA